MKTNTQTLAEALRQLENDIESPDGVANAAIAEAAERMSELVAQIEVLRIAATRITVRADKDGVYTDGIMSDILNLRDVVNSKPSKCLREIQAEAGRAGFLEAAQIYADWPIDKRDYVTVADKYANRIRQGAKP
jgi:hypothetical protein